MYLNHDCIKKQWIHISSIQIWKCSHSVYILHHLGNLAITIFLWSKLIIYTLLALSFTLTISFINNSTCIVIDQYIYLLFSSSHILYLDLINFDSTYTIIDQHLALYLRIRNSTNSRGDLRLYNLRTECLKLNIRYAFIIKSAD